MLQKMENVPDCHVTVS